MQGLFDAVCNWAPHIDTNNVQPNRFPQSGFKHGRSHGAGTDKNGRGKLNRLKKRRAKKAKR